jgi:hypothetical protein
MTIRPFAIGGALLLLCTSGAAAATRTVCFDFKIADNRVDCPRAATGVKRACDPNDLNDPSDGEVDAVGHLYELWDKDDGSDDDYIGTWRIAGSGPRCVTFEWENSSYDHGEDDPDVYMKYINRVKGTASGVAVIAVEANGSAPPVTTWRDGPDSDPDRWVARNCRAGAACAMYSGRLIATTDAGSERGQRLLALDSAQRALQTFGSLFSQDVRMHYPGDDPSTSYADDRNDFHVRESGADEGMVAVHELGHVLQMQLFGEDDLRDECGSSHALDSIETNSCATTEGFADYAAVVSWWDPNNSGSQPWGWAFDFEDATLTSSTCATNADIEGQVARAFWDLDDVDEDDFEAGEGDAAAWPDTVHHSTVEIAEGWRYFATGTDNREDYETGADGVNMLDYYFNNDHRFTDIYTSFIGHNCLLDQAID